MEEKEVGQQQELKEEDQDPSQDTIDTTTDTAATIPNQDDFVQEHNAYYYNDDEQQLQYKRADDRNSIEDDDIAHPYSHTDDYYPMFHDDDHMVSIPPHILSTPTYLELPRHLGESSGDGSSGTTTTSTTDVNPFLMDEYVLIPVSYYFDEDDNHQYHHHHHRQATTITTNPIDTEEKRGLFVASGLVLLDLNHKQFTQHVHLDLSTDSTAPLPSSILHGFGCCCSQ